MKKAALTAMLILGATAINAAPLIVGHRGASVYAPENTTVSQQLAWDLDADGAEFDIWLTADKKLMVCHDRNTSRTANGEISLDLKKSSAAELEKVDVGAWKDPAFKGVTLPHLEDMLAIHPKGKKLFIEIKDQPDTVAPLKKALEATGRPWSEFVIISFQLDTCAEARKQMPEVEVYFLDGAPKKKGSKEPGKFTSEVLKKAKDANLTGVNLDFHGVTEELVKECKDMGMKFLVWTVDDPADVEQMTKWGVEGITTNRPDRTRRVAEEAAK